MAHARAQGRVGGRPRVLSSAGVDAVKAALAAGLPVAQIAALHGVSRRTITRVRAGEYD
nr:helix-turn-helix domain-containing protein [Micrococcus cohnii]